MKLNPSNISIIKRLLVGRSNRPLRTILSKLEPHEIATVFSTLNNSENKKLITSLIDLNMAIEALEETPDQLLENLLSLYDDETIAQLLKSAREDQGAAFLTFLSIDRQDKVFEQLPGALAERIQLCLTYPENSAGRLMQTNFFSLPIDLTMGEGLDLVRERAQQESIYYIYCVDTNNRLQGVVSLRQLATSPQDKNISEVIKERIVSVQAEASAEEVARIVSQYNFVALPVVDSHFRLLGIVTVDDVVDIIQEQATAEIYAQAGLQEDDRVYTPVTESVKNRLPWMILNLGLAAVASWVISQFDYILSGNILLASLLNIVAGMGGNTAIQTLTVVARGLSTGDFSFTSYFKAVRKEVLVGVSNGVFTGVTAGVVTYFWKGHLGISVVICVSMVCNSLVAATLGACIPLTLDKIGLDPAAGSGVLVTTLTDIFSFFSFLTLATVGLALFT